MAERTHRGLLQKAREGKVIREPKANYGFKYNDTEDGLLIHQPEMRIVEKIFRMAASGIGPKAMQTRLYGSPIMDLGEQLLIVVHWHCLSPFHLGVWCSRRVATVQHHLFAIYELAGSLRAAQRELVCGFPLMIKERINSTRGYEIGNSA